MLFTLDHLERILKTHAPVNSVLSVVPSLTELLYDLGQESKVVGVTKFCVHPKRARQIKPKVGGTKKLHLEVIKKLRPQLIIANKEENTQSDIEWLASEFTVWVSDINSLHTAIDAIDQISTLLGCTTEGKGLINEINDQFNSLPSLETRTAVYLIWKKPYMVAGNDTFINHLMGYAGYDNMIERSRYPQVDMQELQRLSPQELLLSSEPYPFKQRDQIDLQALLPNTRVRLVDGEFFSWYGSRLKGAPAYFRQLRK